MLFDNDGQFPVIMTWSPADNDVLVNSLTL